ncbi:MAG: ribosome maturation factor RimP [Anaerovoracaceae bacterium]|jgi:ribosome maturation factor RimP
MAKKNIKKVVSDILAEFLPQNGYELYNVEFVKEAKDWFLRVYIDKAGADDTEFVSTDDCEKVSRYLSAKLDEDDLIKQNYYLEVSSPGMDRELFLPEHYEKYSGRAVDIKLYKALSGKRELTGILSGMKDGVIVIEDEDGKTVELPEAQVAKTRLAVII